LDTRRNLDHQALAPAPFALDLDGRFAPEDGGQERDGELCLHRPSGPGASLATARATAAHAAEDLLEDPATLGFLVRGAGAEELAEIEVFEAGARSRRVAGRPFRVARTGAGGGHTLERGGPVLVVERALLRVGQDVVRLLRLLELGLGLLVAGVDVRVVLARQPSVGFLDGVGGRVARHAQ